MLLRRFGLRALLPLVLPVAAAGSAAAVAFTNTFPNAGTVTIPSVGAASPYPSTLTVAGVTGAVSKVTVTLSQLAHTYPHDIGVLLVSPSGQNLLVMADTGGGFAVTNVTLTFDDAAAASLAEHAQIVSGTYKPSAFNNDFFPPPAPSSPYGATLSVFGGIKPNGVWSLYVIDDTTNDAGTLAGGWSLSVTSTNASTPPTISVVPPETTAFDTPTPPIPFTVGDAQTPAASLLVSAQCSNPTLVPDTNIALGGSDSNRTVTITPATGQSGTGTVTLTVTDGAGLTATDLFLVTVTGPPPPSWQFYRAMSSGGAGTARLSSTRAANGVCSFVLSGSVGSNYVVQSSSNLVSWTDLCTNAMPPGGSVLISDPGRGDAGVFTHPSAITIPLIGTATPYPSAINVSGVTGVVGKVTLTLNGLSHTYPHDIGMLLLGPAGQRVLFMADTGGGLAISNVVLTFDDAATASLGEHTQIVSGTYKPTAFNNDLFPSPAPAGPYGASLSVFNGTNPNGVWSLYIIDDGPADQGTLRGGWTLALTIVPPNTPPVISQFLDQTTPVSTTTPPIPFTVGDVETPASNLVVSAQSSNPALAPATNIVFGGFGTNRSLTITPVPGMSGSAAITVIVTDAGGASASNSFVLTVGGVATTGTFTNGAAITIPLIGTATPYPSTITVSNLAGALSKVTVKVSQLSHTYPHDIGMLLVGPAGQAVVIMADTGGSLAVNNVILTFDDASAQSLPASTQIVTGTYKPTNIGNVDTFAAPAPGRPYGALLSAFNGTNPNGSWSLYVIDDGPGDEGTIAGGWSLNITTDTNAPVPPLNDPFSGAQAISGASGKVTGSTAYATKQAGEPNHASNSGGASLWYSWTAPTNGLVTFDTAQSDFDTLLAVYTGTNVSGLSLVAANNDIDAFNTRSRVTFSATAGVSYQIAVDGANGARGNLVLRWAMASTPLPDLVIFGSAANPHIVTQTFASTSCAVVEGLIQAGTRTIIRFDTQTANQGTADLFFGNPVNNPLFQWAPCHAHYHFQNYIKYTLRDAGGNVVVYGLKIGSCMLDSFRWDPNSATSPKYNCSNQGIQVGWGDLYSSSLDGQWIDITGVPDGSYTLEMQANPMGVIQESDYANNTASIPISIGLPPAPPPNDNFSNAVVLPGGSPSVIGTTVSATKEPGEPNHAGNPGGHSVWYQWTAPSSSPVTIDTVGSSFNTLLAVYTGGSVSNLSLVASNDDIAPGTNLQSRVTFLASAGTVYQIAVDGYNGLAGNLVLTVDQTVDNDYFANCRFIGGVSGTAYGSSVGATKEPGEPNHAGNVGGASVWFCWAAPVNGTATFDTLSSTFDTLLAVYTGDTVSNLTLVASNDDISPGTILQSRVVFTAAASTMYHIAIDGYNGASGNTTLHWNVAASFAALANASIPPAGPVLSYNFLNQGEYQLAISGPPFQRYRIDVSCDLVNWTPVVVTIADSAGHAWFIDKSLMQMNEQSGVGDPICGPGEFTGVAVSSQLKRFYRAAAVGSN
jgi:subtilisin-like proprotein convertase family protein